MDVALKIFAKMIYESEIPVKECKEQLINSAPLFIDTYSMAKELESIFETIPYELTIEQVKKQIKYSKNQMEVKRLNKKLNQMYKEQKMRR
jgi:hypothetical protein